MRADCGGLSDASYSRHGLSVSGARVRAYGLKVEHTFDDLVIWWGEEGETFLFQSELPYHYAAFKGVGYRVVPAVKRHTAVGVGVYAIGRAYTVPTGVRLPPTANATNVFVWSIADDVHAHFGSVVCTSSGEDASATCYAGNRCGWDSCYQLALPTTLPPGAKAAVVAAA